MSAYNSDTSIAKIKELQNSLLKATQAPWRNFLEEASKWITITINNHELSENPGGASISFETALSIGGEEKYCLADRINFDPNVPVCLMEEYAKSAGAIIDGLFSLFFLKQLTAFMAKNELVKLYHEAYKMEADLKK
jgi:hypothetical protein